jgi:L-lactate dehydrogenase (cytochrome)
VLASTGFTVVVGRRERDLSRSLSLPPKIGPPTVLDGALNPGWTLAFLRNEPTRCANVAGRSVGDGASPVTLSDHVNSHFDPSLSWDDNVLVKGIQSIEDGVIAADMTLIGCPDIATLDRNFLALDKEPS